MMRKLQSAVGYCALALWMSAGAPATLAQDRFETPWAELAMALEGRTVSTVLLDGTALKGRVLEVSEDELRFEATKTSNPNLYPKGEIALPKSQVSVFSYTERRGKWRAAGTAIGVGAAAVPAAFLCNAGGCGGGYANSSQWAVASAAIVGAGAAAGYFAGRSADTHETLIVVDKE